MTLIVRRESRSRGGNYSNQGDNADISSEQMVRYLESHGELSIYKLLFAGLEMISNAYYPIIDRLDKHKDELNRLLRKTTTTKNLYALSDLETGMVYLVAAAKQNRMLLEHIKAHAIYRRMNDVEKEQFDDAMIEARQLVSMTELISNVLQQLSRILQQYPEQQPE